jgi:hypothetical protein
MMLKNEKIIIILQRIVPQAFLNSTSNFYLQLPERQMLSESLGTPSSFAEANTG